MLTNRTRTVNDFASMLGVSYRSVYRYIELFQELGLKVDKLGGGVYKIDTDSKVVKALRETLNNEVWGIRQGTFTPKGFINSKEDDLRIP